MQIATTTIDGLLNKRVHLEQPREGYRVAVDSVFLAAAVPAVARDQIVDLGCGVGAAMLCVASRIPSVRGLGIDIQDDLVAICRRNISANAFAQGLCATVADVTDLNPEWDNYFDRAICNPPFHDSTKHDLSENKIKRIANSIESSSLASWIQSAARMLKCSGTLTIIHRFDQLDVLKECLQPSFGNIFVQPLCAKPGQPPTRALICAVKDAPLLVSHHPDFVIHKADGSYSQDAENILRHMAAFDVSRTA